MSASSARRPSTPAPAVAASGVAVRPHCTRARVLTVMGAAVSAFVVWVVAVPMLGVELVVQMGATEQPVGPISVVGTAIIAGLAGWGLLAILERRAARPNMVWTTIAVAVLALSLLGPLGARSAQATVTLLLLHLVVGVVLIISLRASGQQH
ncbi:MAG: DUF6069 family protein [Nakamurella sp.]